MIHIIVSVGIWNEKNQFLMVEEAKPHVKGLWGLPSGRLELNETLIDGAKREVMEETGCEVEITGISGFYHYQTDKGMVARICFNGRLISENKEAILGEDVMSCSWKTKEEIEELIASGKIRSTPAEEIIKQYFKGTNYPLDVLREL